jgi:hypothetical protein
MPGREHLRGELERTATKPAWTAETTLHLSAFEHGVPEFISLSDCVGEFGLKEAVMPNQFCKQLGTGCWNWLVAAAPKVISLVSRPFHKSLPNI